MKRLGCFVKAHYNAGKYRLDTKGAIWYRVAPFVWERVCMPRRSPKSFYRFVKRMEQYGY